MTDNIIVCPECGWKQPSFHTRCQYCKTDLGAAGHADEDVPGLGAQVRELLFHVPDSVNIVELAGRALVLALIAYMGIWAMSMPIRGGALVTSNMHYIHLVFHEAGHMIFRLFGSFLATAGGTLMQLLMPALILGAFLFKYRNCFGAAVGLWWIGHSCLDIAPYAYDARAQELMLLGGVTGRDVPGYHDWNNMLSRLDWLAYDHTIARLFQVLGVLGIIASLAWGGYLLYRQYTHWQRGM